MTRRKYFITRPSKGGYKTPGVCFLSVLIDDNQYRAGHAITGEEIIPLNTSEEAARFLLSLKSGTWVITYHIEWIYNVLGNNLNLFDYVKGTGEDGQLVKVFWGDNIIEIVDFHQFTLDSLYNAAKATGFILTGDNLNRVQCIRHLWELYRDVFIAKFKTHPSKTTGAGALKSLKRFIEKPIKPRGRKIRKIARSAIRPGGLHWQPGYYPTAYMYDINAAYVHCQRVINYPDHVLTFCNEGPIYPNWIATVKLNYSTSLKFPPLPIRSSTTEIFYPAKITDHRLTITYLDFMLLQITGDAEITEWIEGFTWPNQDQEPIFKPWADEVIKFDGQEKYILKVTTRALHSKFAQTDRGRSLTLLPVTAKEAVKYIQSGKVKELIPLENGGLAILLDRNTRAGFRPYLRPEWEALTLAACRLILYPSIDENTIYIDTDCIISTQPRPDLAIGPEAGAWKLDASGPCIILAPRVYTIGNKTRASGIFTDDKASLKHKIKEALDKGKALTSAYEHSNLFTGQEGGYRKHTLKIINYPFVTLRGNQLFITRSPTIQEESIITRRVISPPLDKPID